MIDLIISSTIAGNLIDIVEKEIIKNMVKEK